MGWNKESVTSFVISIKISAGNKNLINCGLGLFFVTNYISKYNKFEIIQSVVLSSSFAAGLFMYFTVKYSDNFVIKFIVKDYVHH